MEIKFCRRCAAPLTKQASEGHYRCQNGHELFYKTGGVAIGLFLVDKNNRVLLATRGIDPDKGKQDVPGGFVEFGETLEQTVAREIQEELAITPDQYETPQYLIGTPNTYQYDGELLYPYDVFFWARTKGDIALSAHDDVSDVQWYNLETFNPDDFAFDSSRRALRRLKEVLVTKTPLG